jgi:hypothetical protein
VKQIYVCISFRPQVRLMLHEDIVKVFDATLLDSDECLLHYYDFRHSLNVIPFPFFGHLTKLIVHKFRQH